jgi:hypothetical protein
VIVVGEGAAERLAVSLGLAMAVNDRLINL